MKRQRTRVLTQPAKQIIKASAPYEFGFAKFLGRKLTPAELAVIRPVEKARKTCRSKPILVIDPPGVDSTDILRQYQSYFLSISEETYGILIHPCGERPRQRKNGRLYMFSPRNTEVARGMSSDFTLLLNVEKYKSSSPFYGKSSRWDNLYCSVYPQLTDSGVLIIHTVMPEGRRLRKYELWLSKLVYLTHIRAEALPKSVTEPDKKGEVPIIIEIDDPRPAKYPVKAPPDKAPPSK